MTRRSIASRLRWSISLLAIAVLIPTGWFASRRTLADINALCDSRLAQSALTLDAMIGQVGLARLTLDGTLPALPDVPVTGHVSGTPTHEVEVGYQVLDTQGRVLLVTENMRSLAVLPDRSAAFNDARIDKRHWRIYTYRDSAHGLTVTAGERYDSRRDVLRALWIEHALPLLLGIPLLAVAVRWSVRRALVPLDTLAALIAVRIDGDRRPVVLARAPAEMRPIVDALNGQFRRIEHALEREQRFSADVAHELRTPLASTMINLDSATTANSSAYSAIALPDAYACLQSLARRTDQLLVLARLDDDADVPRSRIDLCAAARGVIDEQRATHAEETVDLALSVPSPPIWLMAHGPAIDALMRNLVENAVRHVSLHGRVELVVRQEATATVIEVIDDGPGIPPERRDAVFQRFHREATSLGDGFGLGLSIVQRAARLHGASVSLLDAPGGQGLLVSVRLPR